MSLWLTCSRNELLGEVDIDLMSEVQSAPGGDITKTWHLQNVATDWIAAMGLQSECSRECCVPPLYLG